MLSRFASQQACASVAADRAWSAVLCAAAAAWAARSAAARAASAAEAAAAASAAARSAVAWIAEVSAQPAASAAVSTRALTLSAFIFIVERSYGWKNGRRIISQLTLRCNGDACFYCLLTLIGDRWSVTEFACCCGCRIPVTGVPGCRASGPAYNPALRCRG